MNLDTKKSDPTMDERLQSRTIVLVGLMGAGKTTIGRRLAKTLHMVFVDADTEIEAAAGCSVNDIFERHGEPEFRRGERQVVARLLKEAPHVLATGGGAFIDSATRQLIKKKAVSIWLRADLELLLTRVQKRDTRPLLRAGDPKEIMMALMAERYPIYQKADIIIDSVDGPHNTVVRNIIKELTGYYSKSQS